MCPRVRYRDFLFVLDLQLEEWRETFNINKLSFNSYRLFSLRISKLYLCNFDVISLHHVRYKIKRDSALKCNRLTLISYF